MAKYVPGLEPDNISKYLNVLLKELEETYPDHIVDMNLWNHERWDKIAGWLVKELEYPNGTSFLNAYGFTVYRKQDTTPPNIAPKPEENNEKVEMVEAIPSQYSQRNARAKNTQFSGREYDSEEMKPKKRRTWLWVLGWIFIFPLPLSILVWRNEKLSKSARYGIIAAIWLGFYLFGLKGKNRMPDFNQTTYSYNISRETPDKTPAPAMATEKVEVIDVINMSLPEAIAALSEKGFTNITTDAKIDSTWDESRWIVVDQSKREGTSAALNEKIKLSCKKVCQLYIDLHSQSNLFFSTYDMDIFLGDEKLGTVTNGNALTKMMTLTEGTYNLIAYNSGDYNTKASQSIKVTGDMTFQSDISHSGSGIEFVNKKTKDNIDGSSLTMINVTGLTLREGMTRLSEAGFINVQGEPRNDIWNNDNWIIVEQGVPEGTVIDKNEYIQLNCKKLDAYYNNIFANKNLEEAQKIASDARISLSYVDSKSSTNLNDTIQSLTDANKPYWLITKAEQSGTGAKLYLFYEGTPEEKAAAEQKKQEEEAKKAAERKAAAEEARKRNEEAAAATDYQTDEAVTTTPKQTSTPRPTSKPAPKYDVDKDLVVLQCERDEKFDSMYVIVFGEYGSSGNIIKKYSFDGYHEAINPRDMGKNFNAIGPLPSWFYEGATVHVQANLNNSGELKTSGCNVSKATGTSKQSENTSGGSSTTNVTDSGYMSVKGKAVYDSIIAGQTISDSYNSGDYEWYSREATVNGVDFEVASAGQEGNLLCIRVIDIIKTGNTDLFYKVLNTVFSGDDLTTAVNWFDRHVWSEASTKIGDANIILQLTTGGYPILIIVDDAHMGWV